MLITANRPHLKPCPLVGIDRAPCGYSVKKRCAASICLAEAVVLVLVAFEVGVGAAGVLVVGVTEVEGVVDEDSSIAGAAVEGVLGTV